MNDLLSGVTPHDWRMLILGAVVALIIPKVARFSGLLSKIVFSPPFDNVESIFRTVTAIVTAAVFTVGAGSERLNGLGVASMIGASWLFYWVVREQVQYIFEQARSRQADDVHTRTNQREVGPRRGDPSKEDDPNALSNERTNRGDDD